MNNDHNHSQSINSINFYFKNILKNIQDDINSHIDIDHIISKEEQNQYQNQMELDYWNVFFNGINREKNDEKISKDMITDIKNIIDKWKYDIVPWLQIEEIIVDYISESPCYQLKIDDALYRIDNFVNGKVVSIEEKESRIVFITTLLKNCATYACHDGYLPLFTLLQADTIQSVLKQNQSLLLSSLDSPIFMKMLLLCSIIDFVDIFKLIFVIGFGNGNPHLYCGILDSFEIKDLLNVLCWDFYCLFTTKKADEWKSILKEALNFDDNFIRVNDCKVISGLQWKDNLLETFPHNFGPMSPVKKSDIFLGKESKNINTNSQSDPIFFNSKAIEIRLILDPNIPIKAVNAYNIFLSLLNDRLSRKSLLLASKEMSEMIYGKHSRFGGKVGYMLENDDVDMFMDFFNCQKIINRSWNEYQVTNTLFEDCWIDPNLIKISREFPGERMHLNEMVLAS